MAYIDIIWDLDDDPEGNVEHIAEHGITKDEVTEIVENPSGYETSRSSGRPIAFGRTTEGRLIYVVYEDVSEDVIYPVTAYEIEE